MKLSRSDTVLAAHKWRTNGHLIADVAKLYPPSVDAVVLDPTYGRGLWWTKWRPPTLICHDLYTLDGVDFRQLPEDDESIDLVAFDPPYVSVGGRETSTLSRPRDHERLDRRDDTFMDRYGLRDAPRTPELLHEMNMQGLKESVRVLKPGRFVWTKCMDYVTSGQVKPVTYWTMRDAEAMGLRFVDRFEHIGNVRAQPPGRRQVHARRNLSTLLVFYKPRPRWAR